MKTLTALIFAMATCGPGPAPETPEALVRARSAPLNLVRGDGTPISEAGMLADLASARVIYLGERHSRATDHGMQHRLITELYNRDPAMAVGFEMFQTPYQSSLDDWSAGRIDEVALRRESEWDTRWGFDFALYRPILEFIRARHAPAFALNARTEITRAVGRGGLEALSEDDRNALPVLRLGDEAHRAMVEDAISGGGDNPHGPLDAASMDRIYTAQVIWDETMAARIDEALARGPSRIVVLAGRMHVLDGLGIPARTNERSSRSVLAIDEEELEGLVGRTPPASDYLWVVDAESELE